MAAEPDITAVTTSPVRKRRVTRQGMRDRANKRRAQVAALVMQGLRQHEIAERLGVSTGMIAYDIAHLRREWYTEHVEAVNQTIAEDLERLNRGIALVWQRLEQDHDPRALDAITRALDLRFRALGLLPQGMRVDVTADIRNIAVNLGFDPDHAIAVASRLAERTQ